MLKCSGKDGCITSLNQPQRGTNITQVILKTFCTFVPFCGYALFRNTPSKYFANVASSSGLLELNRTAKPISDDSLTTSPQNVTASCSLRRISSHTSSFTSTLPPLNTKHPFRLRS